jgi:hypothetical protein
LRNSAAGIEREHADALALLRNAAVEREKEHGDALELRDARVAELLEEIERNNAALKRAHEDIMNRERLIRDLEAQVEREKVRRKVVANAIRGQLAISQETVMGYLSGDVAIQGSSSAGNGGNSNPVTGEVTSQTIVNPGPGLLFNAGLARRRSTSMGKKRRRYDSGLGFLEEEDEVLDGSVCA